MHNITLCMHTWREVRNFAWHRRNQETNPGTRPKNRDGFGQARTHGHPSYA